MLAGGSRREELSRLSLVAHVGRGGRVGKVQQEVGVVLVLRSLIVSLQARMVGWWSTRRRRADHGGADVLETV